MYIQKIFQVINNRTFLLLLVKILNFFCHFLCVKWVSYFNEKIVYFIYLLSSHICVSLYTLLNCNVQLINRNVYDIHALLYYPPDTWIPSDG